MLNFRKALNTILNSDDYDTRHEAFTVIAEESMGTSRLFLPDGMTDWLEAGSWDGTETPSEIKEEWESA